MKTKEQEASIDIIYLKESNISCYGESLFTYEFNTRKPLKCNTNDYNIRNCKLVYDLEEPETLKEWIQENNIPEEDIIKCLDKKFK